MSSVALEMAIDAATDFQLIGLICAGGPIPGKEQVFGSLLSDLEWPAVEAQLKLRKLPFKVRLPGSTRFEAFNNPAW